MFYISLHMFYIHPTCFTPFPLICNNLPALRNLHLVYTWFTHGLHTYYPHVYLLTLFSAICTNFRLIFTNFTHSLHAPLPWTKWTNFGGLCDMDIHLDSEWTFIVLSSTWIDINWIYSCYIMSWSMLLIKERKVSGDFLSPKPPYLGSITPHFLPP